MAERLGARRRAPRDVRSGAIADTVLGDSGEVSDFGAQQCVIVPDEAAKAELPKAFEGALVFTPLEVWGGVETLSSTRPTRAETRLVYRSTSGWRV